ncbi:Plus3 domain-containing protein [Abeliophyllum distichum]|uniref:Plus3 domain-containing protein n=1 Tax=Abeliophyllum distichum TaxID=126358 RepID=A0ABD1TH06_9LAMI
MSWGRGHEEGTNSSRMVEGIDNDEVLSPAHLTSVLPMPRSPRQAGASGEGTYMIPDDIEFFVPGPIDRADDLPFGCVALNQAVLAVGLRLPFPRMVRKFLREWRIAPTQLCSNGWRILVGFLILWNQLGFPRPSAREFNSLYTFKSDGKRSGGGYTSHESTPESIERARGARAIDENFRSSSALITEENLATAHLSPTTSHRPQPRKP